MGQPARKHSEKFANRLRLKAYSGGSLGPRTRLLQEALDQLLTPLVRDQVMSDAGWDDERDGPADEAMDYRRWVDTKLFPKLVDKTTLTCADELRRHIRTLLAKTDPPPPADPDEASAMASGIRLRRPTPEMPTLIPCAPGSSVLVWSEDRDTLRELQALFGERVQLAVVSDVLELVSTLQVLEGRVSLVLMDRRDADAEDLRVLSPDDLSGHQVVVWGPPQIGSLSYARVLEHAERSVGCSEEAGLGDVADLCTALLGVS